MLLSLRCVNKVAHGAVRHKSLSLLSDLLAGFRRDEIVYSLLHRIELAVTIDAAVQPFDGSRRDDRFDDLGAVILLAPEEMGDSVDGAPDT